MLIGIRMSIAASACCGLLVGRPHGRRRWQRSDVPVLLSLGIFGIAANQILFVCGLNGTTVAHSASLSADAVFVLVGAAIAGWSG